MEHTTQNTQSAHISTFGVVRVAKRDSQIEDALRYFNNRLSVRIRRAFLFREMAKRSVPSSDPGGIALRVVEWYLRSDGGKHRHLKILSSHARPRVAADATDLEEGAWERYIENRYPVTHSIPRPTRGG